MNTILELVLLTILCISGLALEKSGLLSKLFHRLFNGSKGTDEEKVVSFQNEKKRESFGNGTLFRAGLEKPDPYENFDLQTATTRNHVYVNKVLRYPYFQTMSHQAMDINNWVEIDKDYEWYLSEKKRVIEEQGKTAVDSLPENDFACQELLQFLVDFLPLRYPTLFSPIPCSGHGIHNHVTGEKFENIDDKQGVEALTIISRLVQDDFLMGREREDGNVYFVGGLVAFPGFYLLSEKIGKTLEETHEPVPYFKEKLLLSVQRTLKRFEAHQPFERTSWEIVDDRKLFWHNIASLHDGKQVHPSLHPKDLFFRVDHQTFFKLPKSRAMIFGVHPILKRLEDFQNDPLIPALLATIHKEGDSVMMKYKAAPAYQEKMMPFLEEMTRRQIEMGLIKGDEKVAEFRTLLNGRDPPSVQTSLKNPTESEREIMKQNGEKV